MKKRIVSMLLSLALVVTAVPTVPVNATEIAIESNTIESNADDTIDEENYSLADDYEAFNVSATGKVVGSNGVTYDDVAYLSLETVKALDLETQKNYVTFCDEIATWTEAGNEVYNVVIAVDDEGTLHWSYAVPNKQLEEIGHEMLEAVTEEAVTEEVATEEVTTEEAATEETAEEAATEETAIEETAEAETEEATTEEAETEEVTIEEAETEEVTTEVETEEATTEVATEEVTTEEVATEEATTEVATEEATTEVATEEVTTEEVATEETTTEIDLLEAEEIEETEEYIIVSENMDKLPDIKEETFEVAGDVTVERIIDFGYDYSLDMQQANSTLSDVNYFYNQLSSVEKNVYNVIKPKFTAGSNSAKYSGAYVNIKNVAQAVSALDMTYPAKMDWQDRLGMLSFEGTMRGNTCNITITMDKSEYYTKDLVKEANAKVEELATAAQEYAVKNYADKPVYGIVKYIDKWICENNFYNKVGIDRYTNKKDVYHYCHTSFGILLKGYGVCESYALATTRVLDALKIPNMYVTGDAGGGHAWNYVKMPDGKWYMVDSTWNDDGSKSSLKYLLCGEDGIHKALGIGYDGCKPFKFVTLENEKYKANKEILFDKQYDLVVKGSVELETNISYKKTWKSSNTKVAKVSSSGKVTAVGPGTATITMKAAGASATCTVNVHKINNVTFDENNNKSSYSFTHGVPSNQFPKKTFNLTAQQVEGHAYTAEQLVKKGLCEAPVVTSSNTDVAEAKVNLSKDRIILTVLPKAKGTTKIKVEFAGKTATLNYTVKQQLSSSWFNVTKYEGNSVDYTGKAYKPVVEISDKAPEGFKKSDFKITYKNNINASTTDTKAQVIVSGKGNYGGDVVVYEYKIKPINIQGASFTLKNLSKTFNGGNQNPSATVKVMVNGKQKKLSSKDITFTYKGKAVAKDVGEYTVIIAGTGNYTGKIETGEIFVIKETNINKVSVKLAKSKLEYTGTAVKPEVTVKIGKNVIDAKNYAITYRDAKGNTVSKPVEKGKYKVVVTVKGNNIKPTAKKSEITKSFTIK